MTNASTTNKSQLVSLRLPNETIEAIEAILAKSVSQTPGVPYNRTTWIVKAIQEKLDHLDRSNKKKRASKILLMAVGGVGSESVNG